MPVEMRITLRLPLAVHIALKKQSEQAGISLNQLIVERLNASAGNPYRGGSEANVADRVDMLEADVAAIKEHLGLKMLNGNAMSDTAEDSDSTVLDVQAKQLQRMRKSRDG